MEIPNVSQNQVTSTTTSVSPKVAYANTAAASAVATKQDALTSFDTSNLSSNAADKLQKTLSKLDLPDIASNDQRIELSFNKDSGRVIAKVLDRANGDVLREIPTRELQQLFSQMREYLGSFVDEEI
ncbi:flagellar protein FlaG [Thalassospiraceae bacterium SW-3-3]|nr:flagellar protein FlaG [Thalassospiraceae bacterium SW-3-3]